jgi:hypothetical protein
VAWPGQAFEHEPDRGEANEGGGGCREAFEVTREMAFQLIHANVRSTIHRFGKTTKRWRSERLTIAIVQRPVAAIVFAIFAAWYRRISAL